MDIVHEMMYLKCLTLDGKGTFSFCILYTMRTRFCTMTQLDMSNRVLYIYFSD